VKSLAPKSIAFGEITQNNAITRVIQGQQFRYLSKACYGNFLIVNNSNLHHLSHLLVIFLLSTGVPVFKALVWGKPLNSRLRKSATRKRNIVQS